MHETRWCNREKTHSKNCAHIGILKQSDKTRVRLSKVTQYFTQVFSLGTHKRANALNQNLHEAIPLMNSMQGLVRCMQLVALVHQRKKKSLENHRGWRMPEEPCWKTLNHLLLNQLDHITYIACQSSTWTACPLSNSLGNDLSKCQKERWNKPQC